LLLVLLEMHLFTKLVCTLARTEQSDLKVFKAATDTAWLTSYHLNSILRYPLSS